MHVGLDMTGDATFMLRSKSGAVVFEVTSPTSLWSFWSSWSPACAWTPALVSVWSLRVVTNLSQHVICLSRHVICLSHRSLGRACDAQPELQHVVASCDVLQMGSLVLLYYCDVLWCCTLMLCSRVALL